MEVVWKDNELQMHLDEKNISPLGYENSKSGIPYDPEVLSNSDTLKHLLAIKISAIQAFCQMDGEKLKR